MNFARRWPGLNALFSRIPISSGPDSRLAQLLRDRAVRDVLILTPLVLGAGTLLVTQDFFETFVELTSRYENFELDNLLVAGFPASTAITWFSYRRWVDSVKENRRRKAVELDRDELREQLTQVQKMKAIGELAGGIAHDFNNLLMVIDGFGRRAASNLGDKQILEECLNQIIQAGERGTALTRQLLVFSRRQAIEKVVVTVAEVIDGIRGLVKHTLPEKYEVRFDLENPNAKIETDPNEFIQAFLNLIINARDSMADGGRIVIANKCINDADGKRSVQFSIRDTGHGIDKKTLTRIFEPFFTTKARDKGTGLGLAMVYGFVQSCDGRIEVKSEVGQGTEFILTFPRTDNPIVRAKEADASDQYGLGETVLVVQENESILAMVKSQLERLGYNVLTANNAFWALEIDEDYAKPIDVLLTDIIMPGMSGIELAAAMAETRPLMKTIFMSGYSDEANKTGQLPKGAAFLQKPVKLNHLAMVLRDIIEDEERLLAAG